MFKPILFAIFCSSIFLITACTHSVHVVNTDRVFSKRQIKKSKKIESSAEARVIMGFASDTHFADEAYAILQSKCKNGYIHSIRTRYSTSHSFLSWVNTVNMEGYCIK